MFRMLFKDKKNLLSLYNALNRTNYTNVEELEIVTLENAIYMNIKNDLAFIFENSLCLYEHQSTYNPNMPLRDLFYITKELSGIVDDKRLYGSKQVKIPTPRFIVFYNGTKDQPEKQVMRLSEAFESPVETPELELIVTMLNINLGKNQELLDTCKVLREYMQYVTKVRVYMKEKSLEEAVEQTIEECIREDILREFLLKNKKEAMEVCIFEYDEEATIQYIRECEFSLGKSEGKAEGLAYSIITLLDLKGNLSQGLRDKIKLQTDIEVLQEWLQIATKVKSIEEFEKIIKLL
ncbi:MAG: hypothetical protein J6A75_06505 [Lachnospiraceae bacterium]|nr:hypothetical protein [Lachnospiraceae bacterium]